MTVKPIPDGMHSVTAYIGIQGAAKAIDFYKEAFGATHVEDVSDEEIQRRANGLYA